MAVKNIHNATVFTVPVPFHAAVELGLLLATRRNSRVQILDSEVLNFSIIIRFDSNDARFPEGPGSKVQKQKFEVLSRISKFQMIQKHIVIVNLSSSLVWSSWAAKHCLHSNRHSQLSQVSSASSVIMRNCETVK